MFLGFILRGLETWVLNQSPYKNSYPRDFVDKCIKEVLDRILKLEIVTSAVPKKGLMIVLPCLGKLALRFCTRIYRVMKTPQPQFLNCIPG